EKAEQVRRDAVRRFGFLAHAAFRVDQLEREERAGEDRDDDREQQVDLEAKAHTRGHAEKSPLSAKHSSALRDSANVAGCHGLCPAPTAHASLLPAHVRCTRQAFSGRQTRSRSPCTIATGTPPKACA